MKNLLPYKESIAMKEIGFDGRLIPQPTEGETYLKRTNEKVRMLVTKVTPTKVEYMEHHFPAGKEQPIKDFLTKFKLEQ